MAAEQLASISASRTLSPNIEVIPRGSACRRVKLYFEDDDVRCRMELNAQLLLVAAADESNDSTSVILAKKALKYRNIFDRMAEVNVNAPEFNASKFLGVDWCKTESLRKTIAACGLCG